ncbi:AcvB/VirJ family lysyl-phosphatidylglycerol hydrolase [Sphingobium cloacae]|uniref:Virulence factor family protein n=1 Tax=Sphingobium cloacae TaxID=120107 RepID=A0A1E1EZN3_9SPHN|nr:AcvB/VirJ family lysyl-phosphatidylglycerol hydrolase [Sphingobium cloacae]BAV63725.1 virulence factor family protein [Sphingobium cloacae]
MIGKRIRRAMIGIGALLLAAAFILTAMPPGMEPSRAAERRPAAASPPADLAYDFPAMGRIAIDRPRRAPRGIVLLLSDAHGWRQEEQALARRLADADMLVAGISTPAFLQRLGHASRCINPNYAIIDLARDLQHRLAVPLYRKPMIVGRGEGGALAYAALASGPDGSYASALSIGFSPSLPGWKPWCKSGSLKVRTRIAPHRRQWIFAPAGPLPSPWIVIRAALPRSMPGKALRSFIDRAGPARLIEAGDQEGAATDMLALGQLMPFLTPVPEAEAPPHGHPPLPAGLPITLVTDDAAPRTDLMAVLYSGDGGWVGLDKAVAGQLVRAGVPVAGMDSLSYFWSRRTPQGAAADLSAIIRGYSDRWQRPRVLLVGYSFGADVLPHIVAHLPAADRARVEKMALLGLSASADFQFHLASWLNLPSGDSYPTVPAIAQLRGVPMLCVKGQAETDSACPAIPRGLAQVVTVPGGHHFNRNASLLAGLILAGLVRHD